MFIFMSGYGLASSYLSDKETYLKNFPRKRLLTFYLTYLFFVIIYTVYGLITGADISFLQIIHSLTYGGTIVSFGWYFQLTILLYVLFFFTRLIKDNKSFLAVLSILIIAFVASNYFIGEQELVYVPSLSFLAGVFMGHIHRNEKKKSVSAAQSIVLFLMGAVVFSAFTVTGILIDYGYFDAVPNRNLVNFAKLIFMILADWGFIATVMSLVGLLCKSVPVMINNPISRFMGKNCLEIYALQGLFLISLNKVISNRLIYAFVSAVCIISAATALHLPIKFIMNKIKGSGAI